MSPRLADIAAPIHRRLSPVGHIGTWEPGPADRVAARVRRPLDREFLRRVGDLSTHARLGASVAAAAPRLEPGARRVLVVTLRSWPDHAAIQTIIALALRLRGAEVAVLTCGGGMPKCEVGWARRAWPRPCDRCAWYTDQLHAATPLGEYRLRDHLPWGGRPQDAPAAPEPEPGDDGFDPYATSYTSVAWSLRTSRPEHAPRGDDVMRDYAVAAQGVRAAAGAILDSFRPDVVFDFNGMMAADRVIRDVAVERGLDVPTYEYSTRAGTLTFSRDPSSPRLDTRKLWADFRDAPLTPEQDAALDAMLRSREESTDPRESFFGGAVDEPARLRAALDLPEGAPIAAMFTNLSWDSAVLGCDIAWPSMADFIEDVVRRAGELSDRYLVLRVHPAETRWKSLEHVQTVVRSRLGGVLPGNVRVVESDEALSSYALLGMADRVIAYTTTVGLEAAIRGLPVAVGGDTHYRGKGFTTDLERREDLAAFLHAPPARLEPSAVDLARRYAYTVFFRALVPFPLIETTPAGGIARMPSTAAEIAPGADPYLDFICDRILDGGEFRLPEALMGAGGTEPTPDHPAPVGSESGRRT